MSVHCVYSVIKYIKVWYSAYILLLINNLMKVNFYLCNGNIEAETMWHIL